MPPAYVELIGTIAAAITTLCFLPQVIRVLRTRDTGAISLVMYLMMIVGIALWLVYGALIASWPLVGANIVSFFLAAIILGMKLRHG